MSIGPAASSITCASSAARPTASWTPFPSMPYSRKAFEIFSQQLKARGIEIVWDLEDPLPPVNADSNRLEQVFINLLINARDAIEENVSAHPQLKGEKKIFLTSRRREGMVEVEVRDSGKGIPPSVIEKDF